MAEKTLKTSAFNEQMFTQKKSILRAIFREEIPNSVFKIAVKINGVVTIYEKTEDAISAGYASVVGGELKLISPPNDGDITMLFTRRHPPFHPDVGKRNSPSLFYDSYENGDHEVGFVNFNTSTLEIEDGITFQLLQNEPYANIYSIVNTGNPQKYHEPIEKTNIELCGLLGKWNKGHLLDIQAQLRNVGDIYWFLSSIVDEGPKEVHQYYGLNKHDKITVSTPALHGVFIVRTVGENVSQMRIGCLSIANESQDDELEQSVVFDNHSNVTVRTEVALGAGNEEVIYLIKAPYTYKGISNTRDSDFYSAIFSSDKFAKIKMYRLPNELNLRKTGDIPLVSTDWTSKNDSSLQFIDNSLDLPSQSSVRVLPYDTSLLDNIGGTVADLGDKGVINNPDPKRIPQDLVHGEVLMFTGIASPTAASVNMNSCYLGEQI